MTEEKELEVAAFGLGTRRLSVRAFRNQPEFLTRPIILSLFQVYLNTSTVRLSFFSNSLSSLVLVFGPIRDEKPETEEGSHQSNDSA